MKYPGSNLSLKAKLICSFVLVGVSPLIVSNITSYLQAANEIETQAIERAKLIAQGKAAEILNYFNREKMSLIDLASNPSTIEALENFSESFTKENYSEEKLKEFKLALIDFYSKEFGSLYLEKTNQIFLHENTISKLDAWAIAAQYDFIVKNENPIGKKDKLHRPKRDNAYAENHVRYHDHFREYLSRHSLYDVFLVNSEGRIVYSVFKETDFGTQLKIGPWADSGLARAFLSTEKLASGQVHIEDFASYTPSFEAPASFAATPIYKNGKVIGSIIIQLPLDQISMVANQESGLGTKGETLLLGADLKLRADSRRNKETHNVAASFKPNSKISVESEAVRLVQKGNSGYLDNESYDGTQTLAYYLPMNIENLTWYIVTELSAEEVYTGLRKLTFILTTIVLSAILAIALAALIFGRSLVSQLERMISALYASSSQVSTAATETASSSVQLSESSVLQASSLQETMASTEQISAMVRKNSESAIQAQNVVASNKSAAEEGAKSIDEMLEAILEIKSTNEQFLQQMESSNREFGELIQIISGIGQKTTVINEIVFQTKLLSFNASVEAARAGEQGKGFSVVAGEIGNLAKMSGDAAQEISDILLQSTKRVHTIIERAKTRVDHLIEIGRDSVVKGQDKAERCKSSIDSISESARTVVLMMSEINQASNEQSQGIQEINKAITLLDQVTQKTSALAQQSSTQAEHLNEEADSLTEIVASMNSFVSGNQTTKDSMKQFSSSIDEKIEEQNDQQIAS